MKYQNYFYLKKFKKKINFAFFTSQGGVSKGDFSSLNCGLCKKDSKENVKKNIRIALKNIGVERKKLILINQIHSNKIYHIDNKNYKDKFYGDGLITKDKKFALAVLTADCAPIFIFNHKKNIACCLHSGWKGTLGNIINKCVLKLKDSEKESNEIVAVVGPCIGFNNYEVSKNFKNKFIKKNKQYNKFFKSKSEYKDRFDLRGIINYQLKEAGITNIYNIKRDTYQNSDIFFSYRRSINQSKINTGRMINIISLRD